ncbi:MAG TPA: ABC transporter permease [Rhodothermales bacterium]|nr:ABC transporter permease [Rhodothermales bacterium]
MATAAMRPVLALWSREMRKFVRDRSRLVGALAQPAGFWLLLGLGFHSTFHIPGGAAADVGYMEFLYPGIIAMILLFTAIFSTISIVEERKSGFLQAALVAPAPRISLVFGNVLGGTTLAVAESMLFLLLAPVVGLSPTPLGVLIVLVVSLLTGFSFTALGFIIAWRMESTRGFHAVMNLFLLPLWFLSGAPFPAVGASWPLQWIMAVNPVSYSVNAMRIALYLPGQAPVAFASLGTSLLITVILAAFLVGLAVYVVKRPLYA